MARLATQGKGQDVLKIDGVPSPAFGRFLRSVNGQSSFWAGALQLNGELLVWASRSEMA